MNENGVSKEELHNNVMAWNQPQIHAVLDGTEPPTSEKQEVLSSEIFDLPTEQDFGGKLSKQRLLKRFKGNYNN